MEQLKYDQNQPNHLIQNTPMKEINDLPYNINIIDYAKSKSILIILLLFLSTSSFGQWTANLWERFERASAKVIPKLAFVALFLLCTNLTNAQWMLINESGGTPNASAALELQSTDRGFLAPRMSSAEMNAISTPAAGLLIYNTDSSAFFYNNGSGWANIASAGATQFAVPAGSILSFAGDTANIPAGFLLCNGASLAQASYSELYAAIGKAWGGDATNFNLPDLRGRFLRGTAYGSTNDPDRAARTAISAGGNTGDEVGSVQGDNFESHDHSIPLRLRVGNTGQTWDNSYGSGNAPDGKVVAASGSSYTDVKYPNNSSEGGNETRPVNANVNYIICYSSSIAAAGTNSSVFQGSISSTQLPNSVKDSSRITDNDGSAKVQALSSDVITFSTSSTEAMRIGANGYVGINTNTPQQLLDVAGTAVIDSLRIYNAYALPGDGGTNGQVLQTDGNGKATWETLTASPWSVSGSDVYRASGNVGIGITSPTSALEINYDGSPQISVAPKTTNTGQIAEFRLMGATHKSDTSRTASIVLGNYDQDFTSTKFMGSISGETTNNAQNEGDMVFYRYPDGKTATEAIRIERFGDISFHSGTDSYTFPTTRGTNNQVLSTDASGSLSWTGIPSSADNLGNHTATTNVELGGNWLSNDGGNEGIQIDNSGNVGIGTTTPNGALHIGNSAGGFRKVILFENSNNDYQYYGFGISPSSLRYSVAATAARHLFVAGNSANSTDTLMVIQGNGNVGIGTFSPSDQLEVVGGITTDGFKLSGNGAGATKVLTSDGTGNATWQAVPSSADNLGNHTATSNIQLNSNWLSNDGGNEGIRVTDAGDIGIGTGSPQTQLHLHTAASAGNYMQITNGTSTTRGLQVGINNAGVAYILQKENFDFKIRTNDIDRLTIQADGDVGIGTATPAFALDVAGDVMANDNNFIVLDSAGNNIEFSGQGNASYASYGAYIRTTSNPSSGEAIFRVLSSGGAERLRVEHSGYVRTVDGLTVEGNVGIGNTTPAVELDVTGDAQVSGKTTTATFQMTTGSALNGKVLTADGSGNGTWETIPSSADDLGNHTATSNIQLNNNWLSNDGGNEGIRVTDAGDVGIGTDSPTGLFTISDNSRNMLTLKRSTTNDDSTGIVFQNTGNAYTWNMYLNASQDLVFSSSNGNTNIDALSPKVFFDNDGNVGIGTITPTAQLHVNGTAAADGSTGQIQIDETGGNSMMLGRTSSFGFIQTQNSEPLVLNPTSNNVGIGTSSPASLVHMHDATAPYLQLSNSTTGSTASDGFRLGISGNHVFFRNYENGDIRFRTQDQNRMVVLGNGDVGVGTASPLSKFHVAGGTILVDNSNGLAYRNAANSGNRNMIKSTSGDDVIIAGTNTNNIEFDVSGGNDAMYMESGGFIGMGTTNPIRKLDVRDNTSGVVLRVENNSSTTGAGGMALALNVASPGTSDNFIYFLGNGSTVVGSVTGGGSGGVAYNTTSDRRLKTNIAAFTSGLELISEIDPKIYERKSNLGNKEIGFIAQELMKSFPGAVSGDSTNNVDEKPMLVDYSKLTPVLTAGIKELHQMVLEQQALISSQKFEIEQLKAAREEDISKQAETESRLNAIEKLLLTGAVIEE